MNNLTIIIITLLVNYALWGLAWFVLEYTHIEFIIHFKQLIRTYFGIRRKK